MKRSDAPAKQPVPFGVNGTRESLLATAQPSSARASYDAGFPPITMTAKASGGLPPKGPDFNQILYELSDLGRWGSAGALQKFDATFSTAIGGYPEGSLLMSDDSTVIYLSTVDDNTANPNSDLTGWVNLGSFLGADTTLRSDLASSEEGKGASIVNLENGRNLQNKSSDVITPLDYGAIGDGLTNDTDKFHDLEEEINGQEVYLLGKTYLLDSIPNLNTYHGGVFLVSGISYYSSNIYARDISGVSIVGDSGSNFPDDYIMSPNLFSYRTGTFAAGGSLNSATKAAQTIAIGPDAMGNTILSFENIAIGETALQNVQATTDAYSTATGADAGTRNIAVGGNAGQFMSNGRRNIFIGRNAGTGSVNVSETTSVGAGSLFGYNVNGWYPYVENYIPNANTATTISAYGCNAGQVYAGTSISAFGHAAASNLKTGDANCFFGVGAGRDIEKNVGWNGYVRTDYGAGETVNYTKTGSNIVVTRAAHSAVVGGTAFILWNNDGPAYPNHGHAFRLPVISTTADTFTVSCPYPANGSGTAVLYWSTSTVLDTASRHNVYLGHNAGLTAPVSQNSTVIGSLTCQLVSSSISNSTIIGMNSGQNLTQAVSGVTVLGYNALRNNTGTTVNCTALGYQAGLLMQDGSTPSVSVNNSTMLGANSRVSGNNQVQLGDSSTTTYVYGTVQARSDERDKADIEDIPGDLAVDFIRGLSSKFYRWDYRDDYVSTDGDEVIVAERDGSKKRQRLHAGYIAQQVKELMDSLGIDFGIYQDHLIDGGCDVKTIGYDESIPFISKALSVAFDRLDDIEIRLSKIESK